jgi:hypothetical protein
VLLLISGILVIVSAGFLALPKHARMANPLVDSEPDPVTMQAAKKATEEVY